MFWLYLAIMAGSTYLIRAIPFATMHGKIENRFLKSFLTYIPYAVLAAMTIPGMFYATGSVLSAVAALAVAVICAFIRPSLTLVAMAACLAVFLTELAL